MGISLQEGDSLLVYFAGGVHYYRRNCFDFMKGYSMDSLAKTIEDLSLNAWPSHQIQFYDGWLLRFSYFYTHRTNSVEQIGPSSIPLAEKITFCEEAYRKWGTPAIFKISPLLDPSFDQMLADKGYVVEHTVRNMILPLDASLLPDADAGSRTAPGTVELSSFISSSWIEALFSLKGTTNIMHRQVVPSMYHAIPKDTICACVRDEQGRIISTGLGILDRNYIGVYAIHVHPSFRRMGIARRLVSTILQEGRRQGASRAYLQVVDDNAGAIALYESLGFSHAYSDWFRVKHLF